MKLLTLPLFATTLFLKNTFSWSRILFEAFAFQVSIICLIVLNIFLGYSLYSTYSYHQTAQAQLETAERQLTEQRHFWNDLAEKAPGHRQVQAARKTLAE